MPSGTRRTIPFVLLLAAALSGPPVAGASEESALPLERVRVTDRALQLTLDAGLQRSPTLRRLVEELRQSDVIVHIAPRATTAQDTLGGELRFVAVSGGVRYLRIRVRQDLARPRVIAMLAHELQHAVEVAGAAAVVDEPSLDDLYHSIGYRVGTHQHETDAAVRVGAQVLGELTRAGRRSD